jgi:hypothetical protein
MKWIPYDPLLELPRAPSFFFWLLKLEECSGWTVGGVLELEEWSYASSPLIVQLNLINNLSYMEECSTWRCPSLAYNG